ncbi:MAG: 5'/3'-nucleotidase SurE [Planctomycetota bacterium]
MRRTILLTNDDGYWAPGILALHRALSVRNDVIVVAPDTHMSGVGHAITIVRPLRYDRLPDRLGLTGYWVNGTPADCIKLALTRLLPKRPDLVVSGMNLGENTGVSAFYSGTLAGAREGALHRLPSVAFSLGVRARAHLDDYSGQAAWLLDQLHPIAADSRDGDRACAGNPNSILYNVNFPEVAPEQCHGIRVTRQSSSPFADCFEERFDETHGPGMWLAGGRGALEPEADVDSTAHYAGYTTITPLGLDTTAHSARRELAGLDGAQAPRS